MGATLRKHGASLHIDGADQRDMPLADQRGQANVLLRRSSPRGLLRASHTHCLSAIPAAPALHSAEEGSSMSKSITIDEAIQQGTNLSKHALTLFEAAYGQ